MGKTVKAEKIWAYKLKHPDASAKQIAAATKTSYGYVWRLMRKIGTPQEVLTEKKFRGDASDALRRTTPPKDFEQLAVQLTPKKSHVDEPEAMSRAEILSEAARLTTGSREQVHGAMKNNLSCIAGLWNVYLAGKNVLDGSDVALMMALVKIARAKNNPCHADNWVDGAGYMACGGEIGTETASHADINEEGKPFAEGMGF
jgi:hypothetical protein